MATMTLSCASNISLHDIWSNGIRRVFIHYLDTLF